MTAGSAPATARSTIPPAASGKVRRPRTSRCRPTSSSPTPRSGSADGRLLLQGSIMSGHPTYQPQNAFMKWMERRLPIAGLVYSSFVAYPTPRNLNYWWTFGGILILHARRADHHRRRAGDALHAACRYRLQFRRADHARRELRLAVALPARQRRLDVLPRRLHPHVPRHVLRLLQGAARGAVDPRRDLFCC